MNKNYLKILLLTLVTLSISTVELKAQVDIGVDVMNRYVWRGFQFGAGPSIQPGIAYTTGNLEVGFWGAFDTTGDEDGTEFDIYASYTVGDLSIVVTDYSFPTSGVNYFSDNDVHFIEGGLSYGGSEEFPVTVSANMFLVNDDDNSLYFELGVPAGAVDLWIGGTPDKSGQYGTTKAGILNIGLGTGRTIEVTDTFSFDLSGSVITNPYHEDMYLVFGISIW
ncbi:MAG: hypothetical protein WD355_03080 [Balneolaceae bacterium]